MALGIGLRGDLVFLAFAGPGLCDDELVRASGAGVVDWEVLRNLALRSLFEPGDRGSWVGGA